MGENDHLADVETKLRFFDPTTRPGDYVGRLAQPVPSSYDMDAAFMSFQQHGWGNHAVRVRCCRIHAKSRRDQSAPHAMMLDRGRLCY